MPMSGNPNTKQEPISLYFHIPFCKKKCPYCHFYVAPETEKGKERLQKAFLQELQLQKRQIQGRQLASIYFGGGTPWLMEPHRVAELIAESVTISGNPLADDTEITIEANPNGIDKERVKGYLVAGVNRVSIGIQSLDDELLSTLGRTHTVKEAMDAVWECWNGGFRNISIDLMYQLPGQTLDQWRSTVHRVTTLPIQHLSFYNLTIEPHTQFFAQRDQLTSQIPHPDIAAQMYQEGVAILNEAGLKQYEISAFAKDGKQSKHNSGYWSGRPFLGLGPSAFSYWNGARFQNIPNLLRYCDTVEAGEFPVDFHECLNPEAQKRERLAIALRLFKGVELSDDESDLATLLQPLIEQGLIERDGSCYKLSARGCLLYDSVAEEIIAIDTT